MTLEAMQWHESVTLAHAPHDYRRQGAVSLVMPHVRGRRVLDVRALRGELVIPLARQGREVLGLDGFAGAADVANRLASEQGIAGPVVQLWDLTGLSRRMGGRRFDTVVCVDVINHVPDDEALIRDIAAVLAPGGELVLVAPAHPRLLGRRDASLGHLRRYTRRALLELLQRHGLSVTRLRCWNFLALAPYVLLEVLLKRRVPDGLRYVEPKGARRWLNRMLLWWYRVVESRAWFPVGLSWFVIARKTS